METTIDTTNLRQVYFRIDSPYIWGKGISEEDGEVIARESKEILNLIGLTILPEKLKTISNCPPEGIRGCENLYMHPMSFSGILSTETLEKAIEVIQNYKSSIFKVRTIDVYELRDYSFEYINSNMRKQAKIDACDF